MPFCGGAMPVRHGASSAWFPDCLPQRCSRRRRILGLEAVEPQAAGSIARDRSPSDARSTPPHVETSIHCASCVRRSTRNPKPPKHPTPPCSIATRLSSRADTYSNSPQPTQFRYRTPRARSTPTGRELLVSELIVKSNPRLRRCRPSHPARAPLHKSGSVLRVRPLPISTPFSLDRAHTGVALMGRRRLEGPFIFGFRRTVRAAPRPHCRSVFACRTRYRYVSSTGQPVLPVRQRTSRTF